MNIKTRQQLEALPLDERFEWITEHLAQARAFYGWISPVEKRRRKAMQTSSEKATQPALFGWKNRP